MTIDDESYLDNEPLSPLGTELIDTSENGNPKRFRVDEYAGEVEIYVTDRYSVFAIHLSPFLARGLAKTLNKLADKIESETTE